MKKMVLKLELRDDRAKQKALAAVSSLLGIDSVAVAMSDGKMTVIGSVDPVVVVGKLRKSGWPAQLLTVGPAKEERTNMVPIDPIASYNAYYNPHFYCHLPPADDNVNGCVIC